MFKPVHFGLMIGMASAFHVGAGQEQEKQPPDTEVMGKVPHEINPHAAKGNAGPPGRSGAISYHGGPLILGGNNGGVNVYVIWYGNWSGNTALTVIPNFLNSIGGSPYYNINSTYYNGASAHLVNAISYLGSTTDNYSQGTSLGDSQIRTIVSTAIANGSLANDVNGVYFVLTSADVTETSGFCTKYCGWHTYSTINGSNIKYSFVGNPDRCPSACAWQTSSPNGNAGADGMISIIAHELEESASDPNLNAWYDRQGAENADKCAWTFGTTYHTANGSLANMNLKGYDYLIQQNWVNAGSGYCALSYP